ncbi:C40 family peptidase [Nonlabens xiamenensis]|uniref:C40 family peptidase n=1 Tax=Nonlabens xiamenensis TaxID=2341043 RepID=UPI000F615658|nr:TIGR02594 family protein [Nonlabens xiamenensis]
MANLLHIATAEIGVKEKAGPGSNPQILKYAQEAGFKDYNEDDVAWCSLFMNWAALKAGLETTQSLTARSWLNVGIPNTDPEPGDVVVFWRNSPTSWEGHVGIYMGYSKSGSRIYVLGGNQGNQVSITAYEASKVLGFRRLRVKGDVDFSRKNLRRGHTGLEVVKLQDALKQLGHDCGTSDGIFGPKTEAALKQFQSTHPSMSINGIFDKATREHLSGLLNQ